MASGQVSFQERLGVALAGALGWLPVAAFWIYSKQIRIHGKYFPLLSAYSGIDGRETWIDHVAVLRPDIFISLFLLPALIFCTLFLLPRSRLVRAAWITWSVTIAILLFANLHSWGTVGRFLTGSAIVSAATFAVEQPDMISSYIGLRGLMKLFAILAASLFCFLVLTRLWRWRWQVWPSGVAVFLLLPTALGASAISLRSDLVALPVTRDFVWQAALSLADIQQPSPESGIADSQLAQAFIDLTRTPPVSRSPYFGSAKDTDLIVFVMETGSSRFVDLRHDLDSFPTLKRLAPRSIIANAHHAVFPATAESLFSLYTSTYPARSLYSTCIVDANVRITRPFDGFVAALQAAGYATAAYLPFTSVVPLDKALLGNIGLEKLYYAQQHPAVAGMGRDEMALRELLRDIELRISEGRRYAALYLPQIGHAPWPDHPPGRSVQEHGKFVAQAQDRWLSEVVNLLEAKGRLDKTTIVVTGDHGIRTTSEDPAFASGLIDSYSFSVPLLIYSPATLPGPEALKVDRLTTHLDVSPTLLDLYGIAPPSTQQGRHFWTPGLPDRRTYFLANWYFGADGLNDGPRFYMYSEVLGLAFESSALAFSAKQVVHSRADAQAVASSIASLYELQQSWIRANLCR